MFGYVQVNAAELKVKEYTLYKTVYCGLCKAQRRNTGLLSAFTLSYDFVFLYLLRAELIGVPTEFVRKKRRLRGDERQTAVQNDTFAYCAATSALLTYWKLRDDLQDETFSGRFRARLLLPFASLWLKKARKCASMPEEDVRQALHDLAAIEKEGSHPVEEAAECSGRLLAAVASFGIEDPLFRMAAENVGMYVGKWIYLIDAADDLEKDKKTGSFNPFLPEGFREEALRAALDNECNLADKMLSMVRIYDAGYRAILNNILYYGMNDQANAVLEKAAKERQQKNERSL